jgi:hypothetical protein
MEPNTQYMTLTAFQSYLIWIPSPFIYLSAKGKNPTNESPKEKGQKKEKTSKRKSEPPLYYYDVSFIKSSTINIAPQKD